MQLRTYLRIMVVLIACAAPLVVSASSLGQGVTFVETGIVPQSGLPQNPGAPVVLMLIINFSLALVGVLAVAALIYAGLRLILGTGNEEQAAAAKKIMLWAIAGLLVVIFAWVIIQVVVFGFLGVAP